MAVQYYLQKIKLITEPNKKLDETKHAHAEVVKNTKIVVEKQHKRKKTEGNFTLCFSTFVQVHQV